MFWDQDRPFIRKAASGAEDVSEDFPRSENSESHWALAAILFWSILIGVVSLCFELWRLEHNWRLGLA